MARCSTSFWASWPKYSNPATPSYANGDNFQKNQQMILDNEALFMPNGGAGYRRDGRCSRADGFGGVSWLPAMEEEAATATQLLLRQCVPAGAENKDLAKVFMRLPVQRRGRPDLADCRFARRSAHHRHDR